MIIVRNYVGVLRKYAVFGGRATLSEYWWFALAHLSISIALLLAPQGLGVTLNFEEFPSAGFPWLLVAYTIGTFLPVLGLTVRRFHDAGYSGWLALQLLIPTIGWLGVLFYMVKPSEMMDNEHGPYPHRSVGYERKAGAHGRGAARDRYFL